MSACVAIGAKVQVSDYLLWLSIALKVSFAATVVVSAAAVAERSGPLVAGLIMAMPISVGPAYVMLALTTSPQFIAACALGSVAANIAVAAFGMVYVLLARRMPMPASLGLALLALFIVAWLEQHWDPAPLPLLMVSSLALVISSLATRHALSGRKLLAGATRWFDLPLRALFVGLVAGAVVTLSHSIGPDWTGLLAAFPLVLTSSIILMQPRVGAAATAAALATAIQGIVIYPFAFLLIHWFSVDWGVWWAFLGALVAIVGWAALVFAWRAPRSAMRL